MRKLGFSLCVLATLTAQALPLKADDAGSAMKGFGLVGSWSLDCSKDPAKELGSRATYTVPLSGAPTMELINHYKTGEIEDTLTRYDEIQSATRIGDYELQFVSVATKFQHTNPQVANPQTMPPPAQSLILKAGNHIKMLDSRAGDKVFIENGLVKQNGALAPTIEQCTKE